MKKIFIIASLMVAGYIANAQDFKPKKGSVTTDFGITEGLLDTDLDFAEYNDFTESGVLRLRYFTKDNLAIRIGLSSGSNNSTQRIFGYDENEVGTRVSKLNSIGINLGLEKHFKGTDRLSPYIGADLQLGSTSRKYNHTNFDSYDWEYNDDPSYTYSIKEPSRLNLGLRGVIGADYYFTNSLFLGVEAGLGFNYYKNGKSKLTENDGTVTTFQSNYKSNSFSNYVVSAIRFGFKF